MENNINFNVQFDNPIIDIISRNHTIENHALNVSCRIEESGDLRDCFCLAKDEIWGESYLAWEVDEQGDLRGISKRADGSGYNHHLYREYKSNVTAEQQEIFEENIVFGLVTRAEIEKYTNSIGWRVK